MKTFRLNVLEIAAIGFVGFLLVNLVIGAGADGKTLKDRIAGKFGG